MVKKKLPRVKFSSAILIKILQIGLFTLTLSLMPAPNKYFKAVPVTVESYQKEEPLVPERLSEPPPVPVKVPNAIDLSLTAQGVLVKDLESGVVMYAKNEKQTLFPASTTKIMTALVILDKFALDDVLSVKTVITSGRIMNLTSGEELTVEALLYGTLVHSANDAAYTLAENYPGGYDAFIDAMNRKAVELNLTDTHFTNPVGFDDANHYSTAEDLAKLAGYALDNKVIAKIVATRGITVSDVSYLYFHDLKNVNILLGRIAGLSGVKTGFTENAGEILISEVKKNGHSVLFVVLKSADRFGETVQLIDWVFNNFNWVSLAQITPGI
ncbi:MAG: D-alanyl-D-alanine carboxypeptidase [Candidatus Gottesmanbacteria bacterium GW2011_GWA2_43_14]|uniref:D-alanyl-D-alanine carboxypeptidase n=1 Tax=Candidatus Gottesmanbacteria bacterium GW2011_GWA2_43_14 TaxID=1618443 RepID=A0A0G1DE25_9BACT|nr:MAG: D-alanyl-D-alanine carboxypeptidase [Candidatus Gottesmanbacteria bacterium GW2011_GWA2_43_14]